MAATRNQIEDYLVSVYWSASEYMDKITLKESLGHPDLFCDRVKASILMCYIYLMEEYLTQDPYDSNTFFTTDEAEEIMYRINKMCDTNYYLDL